MICKSKAIEPDKMKKFFVDEFNKINKSVHYRNVKIAIDAFATPRRKKKNYKNS